LENETVSSCLCSFHIEEVRSWYICCYY